MVSIILFGLLWLNYSTGTNNSVHSQTFQVSPPHRISAEVLTKIANDWRVQNGLKPYTESSIVCHIAEERLKEVKLDYSHSGFYKETSYFLQEVYLAENLARDWRTEEATFNSFLRSASHSANLKAPYRYACIRSDGNYVVHEFANY